MKNRYQSSYLLVLLACAALFAACQKDEENLVDLTAVIADQPANNANAKVYIESNAGRTFGCWHNGDAVKIRSGANGVAEKEVTVESSNSYKAKINGVTAGTPYTAGYAGAAENVNITDNGKLTITIPSEQTYSSNFAYLGAASKNQIVECPMAAYSADGSVLRFYNVAAMMKVVIENTYEATEANKLTLYSVEVESASAPLSGTETVTVNESGASISGTPSSSSKRVTIAMNDAVKISGGGKDSVYIPVLPFAEGAKSTFIVHVKATDGSSQKHTFHGERSAAITLTQNQIGCVRISLSSENDSVNGFFWGQGTKDCPYLITSESDLINMRDLINSASTGITYNKPTVYYKQTTDIDLSENEDYNDWGSSECPAIGDFTKASSFGANYDGDGHYVKLNITYATSANAQCGYALFGIAGNGNVIKNLTIKGNIMPGDRMYVAGGLIGRITGSITVENCTNEADVRSKYQSRDQTKYGYGGICGTVDASNTSNIIFKKCTNVGTIWDSVNSAGGICGTIIKCNKCSFIECNNGTADNTESKDKIRSWGAPFLGGICGYVYSSVVDTVVFDSCCNYYKMRNAGNVGGIVGRAIQVCKFNKCHNSKTITGTAGYCGGIIGYSTKSLIFTTCNTNSGPILTGSGYAGGLIGYISNSTSLLTCRGITRNESTGTVTSINNGTDYSWIGGIVGYAYGGVDMENCINKANITGKQNVGGIVGWLGTKCTMNNVGNTGIITQQNGNNLAYMGGLIGYASAPRGGVLIKNCFNTGNLISGKSCIGGLIGYLYFDSPIPTTVVTNIYNCYCSNCEITISNSAYYAGGIIGQYRLYNSTSSDNYTMAIHNCYVSATISTGSGNYRGVLYGTYGNNYKVYTENNYYSNTISATTKHAKSSAAAIPHFIDEDTIPKTTINDTAYTNVVNALNAARRAINNGTAIYTELTNNATLRSSLTGLNAWKEEDGKIVFE